ncbi:DHH family phosphoesterase [Candidatus Micrarchaeota archaeon]|nr:DHH family phosphoesterase [Candidatus Micrarchaeota archaeon]
MPALSFKQLVERLRKQRGRTAVVGHALADVDAVASAVVLAKLIHAEAWALDRMRSTAQHVLQRARVRLPTLENVNAFENVVLVDVSNAALLGAHAPAIVKHPNVLAIDHHAHNQMLPVPKYVDARKTSCSEIVFEIAASMKKPLSPALAALLACGILEDSALLKSANQQTIQTLAKLLPQTKKELQELISWLVEEPAVDQRLASLNALKKTRLEKRGEILIACSETNAYESRTSALLIQMGADVAITSNVKRGRISIIKSRHAAIKKLNVGILAKQIALAFNGSGGGHPFIGGIRVSGARSSAAVARTIDAVRSQVTGSRP